MRKDFVADAVSIDHDHGGKVVLERLETVDGLCDVLADTGAQLLRVFAAELKRGREELRVVFVVRGNNARIAEAAVARVDADVDADDHAEAKGHLHAPRCATHLAVDLHCQPLGNWVIVLGRFHAPFYDYLTGH